MTWGFHKRIRLGPFSINLSKLGLSTGAKLGPLSTDNPHAPATAQPAVRWMVAVADDATMTHLFG